MTYQQIASRALGLDGQWNNLIGCLLLTFEDDGSKSIGLGIYYDYSDAVELALETPRYGSSPYCKVLWRWKKLDPDQEITADFNKKLFEEARSVFYPDLSPEWDKTLWESSVKLATGSVSSGVSKNTPQGLGKTVSNLHNSFSEKEKNNDYPISKLIYSRLVNVWSFEMVWSKYMSKLINKVEDQFIVLNFDYQPMELLTGLGGLEFPVWKSTFKIRESGMYKIVNQKEVLV